MFRYSVDIHFDFGMWDTYDVCANTTSDARYLAARRIKDELGEDRARQIDFMRVYKHGTDRLLKEFEIKQKA